MTKLTSSKLHVQQLIDFCKGIDLDLCIFSPGSRNAPIVIGMNSVDTIKSISIPDERSAAFYAVGAAQAKSKISAICCTSGSACLNYAPAIVEAYYQKIPLLVITADRPVDRIDQGAGQSMRQHDVYKNYILGSFQLSEDKLDANQNTFGKIFNLIHSKRKGPIHINVPLSEPLYELSEKSIAEMTYPSKIEKKIESDGFTKPLKHQRKILIIGQHHPDNELNRIINTLSEENKFVVLSECTSNLSGSGIISTIDRVITGIESKDKNLYKPDLIISIGDAIVSKRIKKIWQNNKEIEHWHIADDDFHPDTFQLLTKKINSTATEFLKNTSIDSNLVSFQDNWKILQETKEKKHKEFISTLDFCDFKVMEVLHEKMKNDTVLHLANSTPIRYAQLFPTRKDIIYKSNRGVSGIDGSCSTACGYALYSENKNILLTGDMSFFYDSNALWSNHLPDNLFIIVINNGGGNIFDIIPGPSTSEYKDEFFVAKHNRSIKSLAKAFEVDYTLVTNKKDLEDSIADFYQKSSGFKVVEIDTKKIENKKFLMNYFKFID